MTSKQTKPKSKAKGKKRSGWKGGSFRAAVGMYLGKKVKRASSRWRKSLVKGFAQILGVK